MNALKAMDSMQFDMLFTNAAKAYRKRGMPVEAKAAELQRLFDYIQGQESGKVKTTVETVNLPSQPSLPQLGALQPHEMIQRDEAAIQNAFIDKAQMLLAELDKQGRAAQGREFMLRVPVDAGYDLQNLPRFLANSGLPYTQLYTPNPGLRDTPDFGFWVVKMAKK